ncbi:hypothetical protein OPT61_g5460 [Boeremia exigua]|uniref:Uncharacterized protein n=1 Tax=Boeremia exigua TaxID=749465 RepID=A0ACC2IAB5_9PLEO|nr:hypothetical protein OPT61_g5460 [Boeremia exigua]
MKVAEHGADRVAEAHVHVEGRVSALEEYGEYVDDHDKAICCYVAVEEGDKIRVSGRFSGTTLAVTYDVHVDGVCRKTNSTVGKSVQVQKNKKLDVESFLYQTPNGTVDTNILVAPYSGPMSLDKQGPETVGTIDLCVYVTRQFDVEHENNDTCKYDKASEAGLATYKDLPPQFQMVCEKNCSTLDAPKANREKKKMYAMRAGKEPWAIFRFHYRTKESIFDKNMKLTYHPTDKAFAKKKAHTLDLELVPLLLLGTKPAGKNDGENSIRTSSPPPPDTPLTPAKGSKKSQSSQPKVVVKKQQNKSNLDDAGPTLELKSTKSTQSIGVTELLHEATGAMPTSEDLQSAHTDIKNGHLTTVTAKTASTKIARGDNSVAKAEDGGDSTPTPKKSTKKPVKKAAEPANTDTRKDSANEIVSQVADKEDTKLVDPPTPAVTAEVSTVPTVSHPAGVPGDFDAIAFPNTMAVQANDMPSIKDLVKSGAKGFTSPLKKASAKPTSLEMIISTDLQMPTIPPAPATPTKRPPEGTLTPPPDIKRMKTDILPPLTPTHLLRPVSASPSPRTLSIEAQVAEQRKRLEAMRSKRAEIAKKKAVVDERMAPYKQRMAEELERLSQEMAMEEAMMAEEEEDYNASEKMLAEFERGVDGV